MGRKAWVKGVTAGFAEGGSFRRARLPASLQAASPARRSFPRDGVCLRRPGFSCARETGKRARQGCSPAPPVRRALKRRGQRRSGEKAGGICASAPLMILQAMLVCFSGCPSPHRSRDDYRPGFPRGKPGYWLPLRQVILFAAPPPYPVQAPGEAYASPGRGGAIEHLQVFPAPSLTGKTKPARFATTRRSPFRRRGGIPKGTAFPIIPAKRTLRREEEERPNASKGLRRLR